MAWVEPLQALERAQADAERDARHRRVEIETEAAGSVDGIPWSGFEETCVVTVRKVAPIPIEGNRSAMATEFPFRDRRRMPIKISEATWNGFEPRHSHDMEAIQRHATRQGTQGQRVQNNVQPPEAETLGTMRGYGSDDTLPVRERKSEPQANPGSNTRRGPRLQKHRWAGRRHSN